MAENLYSSKKELRSKLFFLAVTLLFLLPTTLFAKADKIFDENSKTVVVVEGYNFEGFRISQGSGFILSRDGLIITNYHVISGSSNITIKIGKDILHVEALLDLDKENDLVILKIKSSDFPMVKLGTPSNIKIGEKIYVISSPEGFENTITEGIVSGLRDVEKEYEKVLQITAPVSPGSSGGPVFNEKGEVIGVVTFQVEGAQNINFALPVNFTRWTFLQSLTLRHKESTTITLSEYLAEKELPGEYIRLESFREESEKEYINSLAKILVKTQDWSSTPKSPPGKEIEVYKKVLELNPTHATAHTVLFQKYWGMGHKKKALEHYKILKVFHPLKAEALRFLYGL